MAEVNVHEARPQFSQLLRRVAAGEEIIISRAGTPVAKLVALQSPPRRLMGMDEGVVEIPDDFDAPLPEDVLRDFGA